ncbi:glycosyltransferase family A protein [Niastella sp. OAS944]|uniref:glycosyltransferase family A protein n=1 Tax=Niastella sp. OAS944 TaxID=2664089 RepID=UPI003486B1C1|nr:GT2 family glycosyltransferase [Chitinophagaceae bacterium OAS944]
MANLLPISIVMATANRSTILANTLRSVGQQIHQPQEIIIIDGSIDEKTFLLLKEPIHGLSSQVLYQRAVELGAAKQRNQGIQKATCDVIGFMDDDILLEPDCILNLWNALQHSKDAGGVNALITNQHYTTPRFITRLFYQAMMGKRANDFAGKVFGPVVNLLPADDQSLGDVVPVEWLNTTCTLYKKDQLPDPVFDRHFEGYSLMEDLVLSLRVAQTSRLYNVRTARIFHDTQPGVQKNNVQVMSEMDLVNRYYVMRKVMKQKGLMPYLKLIIHQLYFAVATRNIYKPAFLKGKFNGTKQILKST